MEKISEFERGVFYAAFLICELHDEPGIAADIIREANLDGTNIKALDGTEKKVLMGLNKTEHLSLRNV